MGRQVMSGVVGDPWGLAGRALPGTSQAATTSIHPGDADGPPHPDITGLNRYTQFEGYLKAFRSDPNTGELILTIGVRPDHKYAAFPMTDHFNMRYLFDVYKAPRKRRAVDVTEIGDGDGGDDDGE